jgi:hypothetical protein
MADDSAAKDEAIRASIREFADSLRISTWFAKFAEGLGKLGHDPKNICTAAFLWLANTANDREEFVDEAEEIADSHPAWGRKTRTKTRNKP